MKALVAPFLAISLTACAGGSAVGPVRAPDTSHGIVRAGTPDGVNIAASRARATERAFTWAAWSPEAFERARREGKYLLLDGAAEWCHWCHVMDETTYLDPEVARILRERLITVRIDVDEHPDLAERYGDWGWPATIIFSPDGREIGKYRGYLPPEELLSILADLESLAKTSTMRPGLPARSWPLPAASRAPDAHPLRDLASAHFYFVGVNLRIAIRVAQRPLNFRDLFDFGLARQLHCLYPERCG